ncbi:MAG: NlpC/P60 family protein [Actinomycetota bacterium]
MRVRAPRTVLATVLFVLVCGQVILPSPARSQIDAKKAEAAALEAKIAQQGRRLSIANEEYNQANLEKQAIAADAHAARSGVVAAEKRLGEMRKQLGSRVRLMYMRGPGAPIEALLGARSISEIARAQAYGSSVLAADNQLVLDTEKARREVIERAARMESLEGQAKAKEQELAGRRASASGQLQSQRALLSDVKGDIAEIIEEQRRQEIVRAQAATPRQSIPGAAPKVEEPTTPPPPVKGGAGKAVATAAAQIGKPYEWAADGPGSFDCSGLTMYAWASAGVSLPHSSQAQYASLPHVSRAEIRPGDLLFYGSPIHHVGIYEGGGVMINAPETGEFVRRNSISRSDFAGAARP